MLLSYYPINIRVAVYSKFSYMIIALRKSSIVVNSDIVVFNRFPSPADNCQLLSNISIFYNINFEMFRQETLVQKNSRA